MDGELSTPTGVSAAEEKRWGRVLICGGTDWPRLGRKDKVKSEDAGETDLLEPHIQRSLGNIKATSIHTSCSGCHFVVLDTEGTAWLFGRNTLGALGAPSKALEAISENAPKAVLARELPGGKKHTTIIHAACARSHTVLVGSEGQVWTAGANNLGQCGHSQCPESVPFKLVDGPWTEPGNLPTHAAAGVTFTIILTASGKVYAFGSGEHGQLGNGRTGEHIISAGKTGFDIRPEPALVKGLEDHKIVQIACGSQHSVALDEKGFVFVWGYNGYCRLGLGNQQDVLIPKIVPQFAGPNEVTMGAQVVAGPSNTVVIDRQKMYWMAGKWKNTGDGSSGSPYSSFRFMQDIMACKIFHASCGGVTHFALAPDDEEGVMTIAWGQNAANGEMGLGAEEPKSATKPTRQQPLIGIEVFAIAAGQNTTLFLVTPNDKYSDLPRHPDVDTPDMCVECGEDDTEDDPLLACDKCDHPYHPKCLDPPLAAVPDGEWFCPVCAAEPGAGVGEHAPPRKAKAKGKAAGDDGGDGGKKRKASVSRGGRVGGTKRQK